MKFYTWKDIERYCLKKQKVWEATFTGIDIYPDEMIIYHESEITEEIVLDKLSELLPKNFIKERNTIRLDMCDDFLTISLEQEISRKKQSVRPLFKQAVYCESVYPSYALDDLNCPVIAFHSYKGGVGRTLSLIAFAKAWTNLNNGQRLLIIDSDIEAPGLTWIQENINEDSFSYMDFLTLIQDNTDLDRVIDLAAKQMENVTLTIDAAEQRVDHYFLPTARYDEQLFDMYASPSSIIKCKNKEYVLTEVLAKLAKKLGASAVLIDLRAGISEFSAPFLLDPRVKKYCVTSTSDQSVIGTKKVLKFIAKGLNITEESNIPQILLSMVPQYLNNSEKEIIYTDLINVFKTNERNEQLLDNTIVELPFASELVHLTSFSQILSALNGRDMYKAIQNQVLQYYNQPKEEKGYTEEKHKEVLNEIFEFASKQITAESNESAKVLLTEPIKNLCLRFTNQLPTTVIRGAKGSGKTFLYRQLLENKEWSYFCKNILGKETNIENGFFLPVLAPQNMQELKPTIVSCIANLQENVKGTEINNALHLENADTLMGLDETKIDWIQFWNSFFAKSVNPNYSSLEQVNEELKKQHVGIVFLIDGLEEIFKLVSSNVHQQRAIQMLCQNVLNMISAKYEHIGLIIFLRSDMAQNAITVNYEQFKQTFNYAELKWSSDEALKLAVWLVSQAVPEFYEEKIAIENATKDIIDKYLEKLWGLKLGKNSSNEAYSSRWILAALSDFNGQLQARDIIRFLKYAAEPTAKKMTYYDRILMPTEIRLAVSICSKEKITEIKTEYETLKPIFEKLDSLPSSKKNLPMNLEEDSLTPMEEKLMMQAGYLIRDGEKLYLPEIIRHALGFRYEKGARPKVLSLLLKHN